MQTFPFLKTASTIGAPSNQDEAGMRRLSKQLQAGKVVVKLFLAHPLHANLYLHHHDYPLPGAALMHTWSR